MGSKKHRQPNGTPSFQYSASELLKNRRNIETGLHPRILP
jgi:hypothetical protein